MRAASAHGWKEDGVEIVNCREGGSGNQSRFYERDPDGSLPPSWHLQGTIVTPVG